MQRTDDLTQQNTLFGDLGLTGKRIRSMREQLGMTIREWAEQAGIGVASQFEIEQGTCGNEQMVLDSFDVVPRILPTAHRKIDDVLVLYVSSRRVA